MRISFVYASIKVSEVGQASAEWTDDTDYLCEMEQLEPWVPYIREAELRAAKVRVCFNNHARSKSLRNAFLLMDMLLIEHKHKEIQLQDQFTLSEF